MLYVCLNVCMYVCIYVPKYVYVYVYMYASMYVCYVYSVCFEEWENCPKYGSVVEGKK